MNELLVFFLVFLALMALWFWRRGLAARREAYIRGFEWPRGLEARWRRHHPDLSQADFNKVARGLTQFFLAYHRSGHQFVAMPSQVVDDLWHEFILYTRNYQLFCSRAFGRFLHHTPAVVLSDDKKINAGLRRCWWFSCREEKLNPRSPARLPLLFALDASLNVANGFHYVPDCGSVRRQGAGGAVYCGADFSSSSLDGCTDGFGDCGDGGGGDGGGGGCGGGD